WRFSLSALSPNDEIKMLSPPGNKGRLPRSQILADTCSSELFGLALLALALLFNAIFLAPEWRIGQVALNDSVLHLAASEKLAESFAHGEPFLDPWVSEWSLGYPVW